MDHLDHKALKGLKENQALGVIREYAESEDIRDNQAIQEVKVIKDLKDHLDNLEFQDRLEE
ncbi:hypothetical protein [Salmonella sp. s51228]|uniref:hypothetical protein n=1 Tax=Salmonella sp. s51228 TaxID=3159652 RepID=UPI003980694B